ncbi:MAG TPA: hypothetical protein VEP90_17415, partial [Methylomirabilota bacterium]|nr:hypothetical protein [Methylomirabilota bacterium]
DQRQKYMPIITKTRELAYTISPHFAQLRPYLEGPALDYMARNKEHHIGSGYGNMEEREFFWYNFEFALTEAIFLSGYQTGQTFLNFCRQATREIQTAIDNGKIEQGKLEFSMPMLPPLKLSEAKDIFWASLRSFWILIKGKGQYRYTLLQTSPLSDIATEWHSFLMTWPYPSSGSEHFSIKLKNCLFNVLVNLFTINYPFLMILGLVVGGRAYLNKCENYSLILSMLLISWSALFAFCFMMGVVDTIAFPTLQWPEGHNITGFFPLHFLLLISVLAFSCTLKPGISWKLPTL